MTNTHSFRNTAVLLTLYCMLMALPIALEAQFIDLNLDIEPEVTAETQRSLTFGNLATNTGRHSVGLGDMNMGVFSVTALERQELIITLIKPGTLTHNNPAIEDAIPIELYARYGFSYENFRDSFLLSGSTNSIIMEPDIEPGPWNTMYVFIFGAIEIGNVPTGTYSAQLVLNVEYL